jgi:cation:H+ antiporter
MWPHLAIFSVSLLVLVKSADFLVEYSARVARRFQVSDLVVGLVITSVGTSLPELASSLSAAIEGSSGLVIGNVVGSNIANIGLVLGVAALVRPFATEPRMHDRDGVILLASVLIFFALALDNHIGRVDAAVFLMVYLAYVVFAARSDRDAMEHHFRDFLKFFFELEYAAPFARRLLKRGPPTETTPPTEKATDKGPLLVELSIVAASLAALIVSARFVVGEAVWLAELLQLPENLIGLSLVAVGTSLPELLVSVSAARKGKSELIVGNVMGSNIANALLIVGLAAMVRPLDVAELSVVYTIPIMLFFSLALLYFVRSDWRISRVQGAIAVTAYVAFLATAFLQGWG